MRKKVFYMAILCILIFSGCKDYEIIDSKPGAPIDAVTNLASTISGNNVTLSWTLPTSYPNDILQPVSVMVAININGQLVETKEVLNTPISFTYSSYDLSKKYRFTVKVKGNVDTKDLTFSNLRYSLGQTVVL